jgi:hypothetical protein
MVLQLEQLLLLVEVDIKLEMFLEFLVLEHLNVGTNARFSLSNISNLNQIIVDNVQDDFVVGAAKTIQYINRVGITTNLNGTGVLLMKLLKNLMEDILK